MEESREGQEEKGKEIVTEEERYNKRKSAGKIRR